jgi:3-methyladenine DNA glycosylase AlkD
LSNAPELLARQLEDQLRATGTPERAAGEKRYLKSDLEHLGATVWENRRAVKALARQHPDLTHDELLALVKALWARPIFDTRLAAAFLLEACPDELGPQDLECIKLLIGDSHTWALVDVLAGDVLGALLTRHPEAARELDVWVEDEDFWIRRAALLANLEPLKAGQSFDRFARYADALLDETEFFIRKAIGWVLREQGRRDPDQVYEWLKPRIKRASGVTVKEAVKYLTAPQREALQVARADRRQR